MHEKDSVKTSKVRTRMKFRNHKGSKKFDQVVKAPDCNQGLSLVASSNLERASLIFLVRNVLLIT